jgi:hypothetical protein
VRHVLYKDIAQIVNELMDAENLASGETNKKDKDAVKGRTIGEVSRETFRLPVERTGEGWAVILDRDRLDIAKLRFGLDREAEYQQPKPAEKQIDMPVVGRYDKVKGEWVNEQE